MFHSDEVNEEAIFFSNGAYRLLHDSLIPHGSILAGSRLAWLFKLPEAIEILRSTAIEDKIVTECSASGIIYKDFESQQIRRSFTCQFHPELLSDLRTVGMSESHTYSRLKTDNRARLFARMLYEDMQK